MDLYRKRTDYSIGWSYPEIGTKGYNQLEKYEPVTTENEPIMMTGTRGEQWVMSAEKLKRTYQGIPDDLKPGDYGRANPKEGAAPVFMRPAKGQETVHTAWGTELTANQPGADHGKGDMIVFAVDKHGLPNMSDAYVLNGAVFEDTYEKVEEPEKDVEHIKSESFGL